jgi:transcriptional regulator with XRE-family HTH domain
VNVKPKTQVAKKAKPIAPELVPKTEGQRLLVAIAGSHQDVATRLGTSRQAVHQWRRGEKIPGASMRARASEVLGISSDSWDRQPGELATPGPVPPSVPVIGGNEVSELDVLIAHVAAERAKGNLTATNLRDNIKLESQLREQRTKALERAELQETRIVTAHPFWKRIRGTILAALRPYPDATRDVAAALEALRA